MVLLPLLISSPSAIVLTVQRLDIMVGLKAVSYTHLDVYKRQIINSWLQMLNEHSAYVSKDTQLKN